MGNQNRDPFSDSVLGDSSSDPYDEDEINTLQPLQAPHRGSNAHRFGRPDPDRLRRRAISGAMRDTTTTESTFEAPPVPLHRDFAHRRLVQGSDSSVEPSPAPLLPRTAMAEEHAQVSTECPSFGGRDADNNMDYHWNVHKHWERTAGHPEDYEKQTSSSPASPSLEPRMSSHIQGFHRMSPGLVSRPNEAPNFTPTRQQYNPFDSSPPTITESNNNWLLPHPFGYYQEGQMSRDNFDNFSVSTAEAYNKGGVSSDASTPTSLKTSSDSEIGSTCFWKWETASDSSEARTSSPFSKEMDINLAHHSLSATTTAGLAEPSDPFVSSESNRSVPVHRRTPRSQHHRYHEPLESIDTRGGTSHGEAHYSASQALDSGPSSYDFPTKRLPCFGSSEAQHSPKSYFDDAYGQSVVSGPVTQTLTPNTSPFRRGMAPMNVPEGFGNARTKPGTIRTQTNNQPFSESPSHHLRLDSSIISPLRNPISSRYPQRLTTGLDDRRDFIGVRPNSAGTETASILDFDLSSDSESDSEGLGSHALHTTRRARVNEPVNSNLTPDFSDEQDRVVCAISESRSSDMIGVAVINVTMGQVDMIRIVNDDRYRRLTETLWMASTWPQTFLVLKKVVDQQSKSSLTNCLTKEFPKAEVVPLDREHWNESEGLRMVDRFAWRKDINAIRRSLEHNFYVSCAFAAVMAYVEEEAEVVFRENSLRISYKQPADTMGLDRSTLTSLELFQNVRNAKGKHSTLFGLLNNTLTPQGRRMIRSALLQPSTSRDEIVARHDAVEELSSNEDLFTEIRASLKRLLHIDVERSIPWVALKTGEPRLPLQDGVAMIQGRHQIVMGSHEELKDAEKDLNHILMIKAYLGGIRALQETLEVADCTSKLCKWVLEKCRPEHTAPILALIEEAIEQDAIYSKAPIDVRNNRLWAVKSEPNGVLEGSRQLYRDRTNEMHQYVEELNKTFQEHLGTAPELRLANDNHYYLRFQWSDVERELMRQQLGTESGVSSGMRHWRPRPLGGVGIVNGIRRKQHYDCQTLELIQRSSQIQRHADIITGQSDRFIVDLKKSLMEHAESLLTVNEAIAVLDMLSSFAYLATTQNYVRPILSDNMVLKGARHPVVEARKQNFVPNDVYSGDDGARFQIVTGGNMSGKSTFIRTIALIQIMTQIGSFVPATYAGMPICDRLFTRLSTEDKPESNLGTFAVEMTEMNMILRQINKGSLVLIDELGRGTSTKEGLAVALAMSEKLIATGCRVFFATHFTELARVLNATKRRSVINVHVAGESSKLGDSMQISLPHTIAAGPVKNEDYGLDLSRRFLPDRVINNAEQVCKFLRDKNSSRATGPATRAVKQNKLILALPDLLKQAHTSTMDGRALESYLKKLQTEFTIRMNIAADDDLEDDHASDNVDQAGGFLILDKPSDDDLEQWKKKCETAERRVMHANMSQSQERKRPVSADETSENQQKRNKTDSDAQSTVSQPLMINRGSMIEELRRGACTPTTRAETPSSLASNTPDSDMASVMQARPAQESNTETPASKYQRAVSVSSGSSNCDEDMLELDDAENFRASTPQRLDEEENADLVQPLERFQPLKGWYARQERSVDRTSKGSGEASRQNRLGGETFSDMDEEEERMN